MKNRMKKLFQDPLEISLDPIGNWTDEVHWQAFLRASDNYYFLEEAVKDINTIFKILLDMSYQETFDKWLAERPEVVQALAKKFPPGKYTMKEGSPYAITNPGTEVELYSWLETGDVGIIVKAEDKSKDALEHEKMLGAKYHKTEEEMQTIHNSGIRAHVDPEWLELKTSELD
jgi:hypothetical protein